MKKQAATERILLLRDSGISVAFVFLMLLDIWLVVRAVATYPAPHGLLLLLTSGVLGWLLTDLASGAVHFVADNFGSPETPIVGRMVIAPFREHHAAPLDLLKHDILQRNANNALVALPLLSWIPFADFSASWAIFLACGSIQMAIWAAVTNEIHAAAHAPQVSRCVRILQSYGVILSPAHHRAHHSALTATAEHSRFHYCITSGACDRLAEALRSVTKRRGGS